MLSEMAKRAKGCGQSVRLPESVLEPADEWSDEFLASLGAWKEDIERLSQQRLGDLKDPFE